MIPAPEIVMLPLSTSIASARFSILNSPPSLSFASALKVTDRSLLKVSAPSAIASIMMSLSASKTTSALSASASTALLERNKLLPISDGVGVASVIVMFLGSKRAVPTCPSGALKSTLPVIASPSFPDTSANPPLPSISPPCALRCPPY